MADTYIVGVYMTQVTKEPQKSIKDQTEEVVRGALEDAGLCIKDVESMVFTPPGFAGLSSFMHAHHMCYYFGSELKSLVMVECGGCTGATAMKHAYMDVASGRCKVALAVSLDRRVAEIPPGMEFNTFLFMVVTTQTSIYGPYDALYGVGAPIPYYAQAAQRYMHERGIKREDLNWVPVRLREHALKNPLAMYREPITPEDVQNSRLISEPIRILDCSPFASGAACVVFAKEDVSGRRKVKVKGFGEYHFPTSFMPHKDIAYYSPALRKASSEAFNSAGVKPQDIDVVEIYGVFSSTELTILEDIGFFEEGKAVYTFKEGDVGPYSKLYIDPSGGRLSLGHPAAATPVMEMCEIVWQIRGEAGERRKKGKHDLGMIQAEHGMLNGAVVFILEGVE